MLTICSTWNWLKNGVEKWNILHTNKKKRLHYEWNKLEMHYIGFTKNVLTKILSIIVYKALNNVWLRARFFNTHGYQKQTEIIQV